MKREQQRVPLPWQWQHIDRLNAAVLCATQGCDHRGCQGGPFRIAFVYSSETGAWSQFASLDHPNACDDHENLDRKSVV